MVVELGLGAMSNVKVAAVPSVTGEVPGVMLMTGSPPASSSSATVSEAESGSPTLMVTGTLLLCGRRLAVTPVTRTVTVLAASCSLSGTVGILSTLAVPPTETVWYSPATVS